jgi:predicted anti-sigma-YlaC factor YlaD
MRCSTVRSLLPGRAEGSLPRHELEAVTRHLENCPDCTATALRIGQVLGAPRASRSRVDVPSFIVAVNARIDAAAERRVPVWSRPYALVPTVVAVVAVAVAIWRFALPSPDPFDDARLAAEMRTELRDLSSENLAWATHAVTHEPVADASPTFGAGDTLVTAALDEAITATLFRDIADEDLVTAGLDYLTVADLQELVPVEKLDTKNASSTLN